jgi:polysaccharide chain length determinant protein (PEP-CTERM system associated)
VLPGKTFTADDIVRILRRRKWLILLPFAIGFAMAPVIATRVPEVYRSETMIMVIPQRVPDSYVKSTVTATVEDRLPSISDQIMSRSRLERIINDFGLYKSQRAMQPMEDVVRQMRMDVGPPQIKEGEQSFRVSYVSPDPITAQKVTARLASLFIEENSSDRENLADSTNVFLESQLEDAKKRLIEHERKLELYSRAHAGELPTQLESNLGAIQTLQLQLQSVSESTNRARERRLLFEHQLVDAQTFPVGVLTPGQAETRLSPAQQLEAVKSRLQVLKQRYKPEHPEVRAMERSIRELEQKVEEDAKRPPDPNPSKVVSLDEQARQKKIRDLQSEIEVIDHQLSVGQAEEVRLKGLIAEYRRKVEAVPTRESELVELTRDYESLKKSYDSLATKREDSKLAANLERRQIGEQFRILDPASLPERPTNQFQRIGIILSGAAAGLVLGLLFVAFLEFRDSTFAREDEVARVLSLPVLALVPAMPSARDRQRARFRHVMVDVAATVVLLGSATIVLVWGLSQR